MRPAPRLATYADLIALGPDVRGEIIAGAISTAPSPLPRHSRVQGALNRLVGGPFDADDGHGGPGGWWILSDVDVSFSAHDVVRPDVVGWHRDRLVDPWDTRPIAVTPDWVCEVLSPSNAAQDRVVKAQLYAQHAVPFYWIIDPAERTLEAFQWLSGRWTLLGSYDDSRTARIAPFEAIELDISRLFAPR